MSGERGTIRKIFDIGPAAVTSNNTFDGSSAPTTVWSNGILQPGASGTNGVLWLTQLSESVADNGRVGISIAAETLDVRLKINPQDSLTGNNHLRMLIVADNECDGVVPDITEILGDTASAATTVNTGLEISLLQPAYFGRFHIIEDKNWYWYSIASGSVPSYSEMRSPIHFYHEAHHDLKSHRVMWDVTDASAITNARKGHIFAYFIYSSTSVATGGLPVVVTTNPPAIQWTTRLRYRDA